MAQKELSWDLNQAKEMTRAKVLGLGVAEVFQNS